ncbi:hypothetical protein CCP3SC15_600022 [Gammaproteobacteria bacterium]
MTTQSTTGTSVPVVYTFPDTNLPVRVIDQDGEPWFVATDVCDVLDLSNTAMAVRPLDDDEKADVSLADTSSGQRRQFSIISESGLYTLILRSDKPTAKPFRRWVTHEVLPAIRKTGSYEAPGAFTMRDRMAVCRHTLALVKDWREREQQFYSLRSPIIAIIIFIISDE